MADQQTVASRVARELGEAAERVAAVARLLDEGATIPFIARYRKERTGGLDEERLRKISAAIERIVELDRRRSSMIESLAERDVLTADLRRALERASSLAELEDVYLPYRPKRVTRASRARERGLEPLADEIVSDERSAPTAAAKRFVSPENGVASVADALAGASDIIAERVSEDAGTRGQLRDLFARASVIESSRSRSKRDDREAETYRDYFSWSERASRARSHRILAMLRGERQGYLVVHVSPAERDALDLVRRRWVRGAGERAAFLDAAALDAYRRLVLPSLEKEQKNELFRSASEAAADVFSANLRDLLLAPALGEKRVLAMDPGFRTGCKVVCLDERGSLLHDDVIYPLEPKSRTAEAERLVLSLLERYGAHVIAVGNGTGGRETISFLSSVEADLPPVVPVNEAGASVYSASPAAREEFPDHDVTVRGAVSIGRRLMDPLAELVKIDPRSIGVGQYQHDVDPKLLEQRLEATVESCVNRVGADLNTASWHLLRRISGVSERVARSIVAWREEHGGFHARRQLLDVPGIGAKAFEQAAGFLRVRDGREPLDATAIHPERYETVRAMAREADCDVSDLIGDAARIGTIDLHRHLTDEVGMPTLEDIAAELARPGRDPRDPFSVVEFSDEVQSIEDLSVGMRLSGVVTNVTDFGAFVDLGVHRDGLVHVSRLARHFVRNPHEVVSVGQGVEVTVTEIDLDRGRISLSMIES